MQHPGSQHPQFRNSPERFVVDATCGLAASTDDLTWTPDPGYLARRTPLPRGQVAVVSGGGSGHEPLHAGYIGRGMLTAACPGLVFTSPNALQIHGATMAANAGAGVLHIVKNYTGDVLNFSIAADMAREEGVAVERVLVADDLATDTATDTATTTGRRTGDDGKLQDTQGDGWNARGTSGDGGEGEAAGPGGGGGDGEAAESRRGSGRNPLGTGRRGTAATIAVEKICGAAAERGDDLHTLAALGRRVAANARSMAVALRPCTLPGADEPSFDLPDGEIELGIGIHGERGTDRGPAMPASDLVPMMAGRICDVLGLAPGDSVIAIVNGLGATHPLELHVLYAELADYLDGRGIAIARPLVGSFVTALDMAGASITLIRCGGTGDGGGGDEILRLWDAPTDAPGWPNAPATAHHRIDDEQRTAARAHAGVGDERAADGTVTADAPGSLGGPPVGAWLAHWAERVLAAESELTALDRRAGDGDFGTNMTAALTTVDTAALREAKSPAAAFGAIADAYFVHAGGTSGALFGLWFRNLRLAAADVEPRGLDVDALRRAGRRALDAITELGGAHPGDKTMVDALDPAVRALEDADGDLASALSSAARSARDGAEGTAGITAARGRASYLGEAARDVTDPGALVMAWLFEAASATVTPPEG